MSVDLLTAEQWSAFLERLAGPDGCDFREAPDKPLGFTWRCRGGWDQSLAAATLAKMAVPLTTAMAVLDYCRSLGGHCDCEILFNASGRIEEQLAS